MPSSRATLATTHWVLRAAFDSCPDSVSLGWNHGTLATMAATLPYRRSFGAAMTRTRASGTSSSSATSIASAVCTPWPGPATLPGNQHRQRRVHALAHLASVHGEENAAVAGDLDPAVEAHLAVLHRQGVDAAEAAARRQQTPADDERAGAAETAEQQGAALHAGALMRPKRRAAARGQRHGSRRGCAGRCRNGRYW